MKRKPSGRTLCNVAKQFFSPNPEHINQIEMFKPRYRPTSPNWGGKREGSGRKKSTVRISVPVDCLPEIQQKKQENFPAKKWVKASDEAVYDADDNKIFDIKNLGDNPVIIL